MCCELGFAVHDNNAAVMYRLEAVVISLPILACWLLWSSALNLQQDLGTGLMHVLLVEHLLHAIRSLYIQT